ASAQSRMDRIGHTRPEKPIVGTNSQKTWSAGATRRVPSHNPRPTGLITQPPLELTRRAHPATGGQDERQARSGVTEGNARAGQDPALVTNVMYITLLCAPG